MEIRERGHLEDFEPDWLGNRELPKKDRVTLRIRLITVGDQAERDAKRVIASVGKRGKRAVAKLAADEPFRVLRDHVVSVDGLKLKRLDGTVLEPKTGAELADAIKDQPQGEPWSSFMDEVLGFISGESKLGEDAGNEYAPPLAS